MKYIFLVLALFLFVGCADKSDIVDEIEEFSTENSLDVTSNWKTYAKEGMFSFQYPRELFSVLEEANQALPFAPIMNCDTDFQGYQDVCKYELITLSSNVDQSVKFYFAIVDYDSESFHNISRVSDIQIADTELSGRICLSIENNILLPSNPEKALFVAFESLEDVSVNNRGALSKRCSEVNNAEIIRGIINSIVAL